MDWLTPEQVKRRSLTRGGAVQVSRLHWLQLTTCTEEELKEAIKLAENIPYNLSSIPLMSRDLCGLCQYYGSSCKRAHSTCPLRPNASSTCCCEELFVAAKAYNAWRNSPTPSSFKKLQTKGKKVYKRLMKIKI